MTLTPVLDAVDAGLDASVARLFELLRIPSISTDPAFDEACTEAADWLVAQLSDLGFEDARRDTPGKPMVVAHHWGAGPKLLIYGHYDVQPVDPLDLWHRDPFDPALEDTPNGKVIRARGASDDKGQLMTFVEAFRAYKAATGSLPGNLTILFEGEEESGSPSIIPFLTENKEELTADLCLVCDTGLFDPQTPSITTMLRGMQAAEFTVIGPNKDLHSGMYGGPAMNPIRVISNLIASMHDENGRVQIPAFYEGVEPVPNAVKAGWDSLPFDGAAFLGEVGLSEPAGEKGYTVLEQIWSRPTAEVNGVWGGYTGAGTKTVLPSKASAKVTFRLVGKQDPEAIAKNFQAFLSEQLPPDYELEFDAGHGAQATVMPTDRAEYAAARAALGKEWENDAVFIGGGGSIPIVGHFRDILGVDSILIGYGLEDDNIHSPNEKYNLTSFHRGIRSWVRVLDALNS
ncbi:MAG: M20/M25/M40 family metallo-hydrolase [Pseudomonadota bacterium]